MSYTMIDAQIDAILHDYSDGDLNDAETRKGIKNLILDEVIAKCITEGDRISGLPECDCPGGHSDLAEKCYDIAEMIRKMKD